MAITIRRISIEAEKSIEQIQKEKEFINTKTKAIEFALERFPVNSYDIEKKDKEISVLKRKLAEAEYKISVIAKGFNMMKIVAESEFDSNDEY